MNPKWIKHFQIEYFFEKQQQLHWEVYDFDSETDVELIGSADTFLIDILRSPKGVYLATLVNEGKHSGTLKIKADILNQSGDDIKFHCQASLITKRVLCCGTDSPYLMIERARVCDVEEKTT